MNTTAQIIDRDTCQQARLSRDPRFDGLFFTAVKTTGIYCRPICPATPPKESNVDYYSSAVAAAKDGFRPCLRCRPDAAPHSAAWLGTGSVLNRAIRLIDSGFLIDGSLAELAHQLGITDRHLRQLFNKHLGTSPRQYATYQQCLFAKQLLHQTQLPMSDVAMASGFGSVRRFNASIKQVMQLTPSQIRRSIKNQDQGIRLIMSYRPPFDWSHWMDFMASRLIDGLEWMNDGAYGRTILWGQAQGSFEVRHLANKHAIEAKISIDHLPDLMPIINNIRRVLDLDVDMHMVNQCLKPVQDMGIDINPGLRLPGTWSVFEAGIRAILGQQVSVTAAKKLVSTLVHETGTNQGDLSHFPTPEQLQNHSLDCLKMPGARKQSIRDLARHMLTHPNATNPDTWLKIKGIGPWTVDYAKMRGLSDPDIYLGGDLGVKKAVNALGSDWSDPTLSAIKPWRSYLTFQLWNQS